LTSGLLVVALGVVLTALVVFAMRGQYKQSSVIHDTRNAPYAVDVGDDHATCLNTYEALT
jgi:hypothetical protein